MLLAFKQKIPGFRPALGYPFLELFMELDVVHNGYALASTEPRE